MNEDKSRAGVSRPGSRLRNAIRRQVCQLHSGDCHNAPLFTRHTAILRKTLKEGAVTAHTEVIRDRDGLVSVVVGASDKLNRR